MKRNLERKKERDCVAFGLQEGWEQEGLSWKTQEAGGISCSLNAGLGTGTPLPSRAHSSWLTA